MKKWILTGLLIALFSGIGFRDVFAQKWAKDGAGCVPTSSNSHFIVAGRIGFKATKIGSITVICPVSVNVGHVTTIGVAYLDSTGIGTSAGIQASLRRINKFNGSVSTVTGFVFDSNNFPETNWTFKEPFASSHTLDDLNFYYFVQVTLSRSSTAEIVEFGGVELQDVIP